MSEHVFISENIILLCFFLIMAVILAQIIDKLGITWLPASGAQMIFGFVVGVFVFWISADELDFLMFKSDFFFFALLPPIVFEAGYSMKRTNFFRNMGSILLFAFVGTVISTFVIGFGLYVLALWGVLSIEKNALDPLTFGALISSIDPIATLAILGNKDLRCDPLLYSLVFGESVLNDAVAITLYQTFIGFRSEASFGASQFWSAMGKFALICVGSLFIGAVVALLCAFLLRLLNFSRKPSNEFIIIFFSAYLCYCLAELTHMSGIMALFICGVMQAHYAWYNISSVSRTTTRHAFHSFAHIAEALLYVYFGISAFFSTRAELGFEWSFSLIVASCILCVLARALNIFPLAFLANLGRKRKISFKMQIVMWFSGLRGAISFALAIAMESPNKGAKQFITTTMVIIALTTLGMGGACSWVLGKLGMTGVEGGDEEEGVEMSTVGTGSSLESHGNRTVDGDIQNSQSSQRLPRSFKSHIEINRRRWCKNFDLHKTWVWFDSQYVQPYFGGRHAPKLEDFSASHDDHGDNSQMVNPYLMERVQEKESAIDAYERGLIAGKSSDELDMEEAMALEQQNLYGNGGDYQPDPLDDGYSYNNNIYEHSNPFTQELR